MWLQTDAHLAGGCAHALVARHDAFEVARACCPFYSFGGTCGDSNTNKMNTTCAYYVATIEFQRVARVPFSLELHSRWALAKSFVGLVYFYNSRYSLQVLHVHRTKSAKVLIYLSLLLHFRFYEEVIEKENKWRRKIGIGPSQECAHTLYRKSSIYNSLNYVSHNLTFSSPSFGVM
jgi:hypothetical protein